MSVKKLPTQGDTFAKRFMLAWQSYERMLGHRVRAMDLAAALGVSKASVSVWQHAEEPPPNATILQIAAVCRVDPGWLAFGDQSNAAPPGGGILPVQPELGLPKQTGTRLPLRERQEAERKKRRGR